MSDSLLLGNALSKLGHSLGGQHLLELPDDVPPSFVERLVQGANEVRAIHQPYCLLVHPSRDDLRHIPNSVNMRELARFRTAERLAIIHASDNRGMSTYSSVFSPLFSPAFPEGHDGASASGSSGLAQFLSCLAAVISERAGLDNNSARVVELSMLAVGNFLTEACVEVGNGKSSLAADWWQIIDVWAPAIYEALKTRPSDVPIAALCYGAAGLPVPESDAATRGYTYSSLDPSKYVSALRARWPNAAAVQREIARLALFPSAHSACEQLSTVPWDIDLERYGLDSHSPVVRVTLAGTQDHTQRLARTMGWARLTESDFHESFTSGALTLRVRNTELPRPWKLACPVLLLRDDEDGAGKSPDCHINEVTLTIPWKQGRTPRSLNASDIDQIKLTGIRGTTANFLPYRIDHAGDGARLTGTLVVTPAKKAPGLLALELNVVGPLSRDVLDRVETLVTLVRSNEVAGFLKPVSRGRVSQSEYVGPVFWSQPDGPRQLPYRKPGRYEVMVATGSASGALASSLTADTANFVTGWSHDATLASGFGSIQLHLQAQASVEKDKSVLFELSSERDEQSPLSPLLACATGQQPDSKRNLPCSVFSALERHLLASINSNDGALGAAIASTARSASLPTSITSAGVLIAPSLHSKLAGLRPGLPSARLLSLPEYSKLRDSYRILGIESRIGELEKKQKSDGLTVSRIILTDFISHQAIVQLLDDYTALISAAQKIGTYSDRFWARNPFSVALFPERAGAQEFEAVLMSPLHPIRLAWLWHVQAALRSGYEDGARACDALSLIDPTAFPAVGREMDPVKRTQTDLRPVPVDPSPDGLYVGWHAMVPVRGMGELKAPEWLCGERFPISGLSGLSNGSVSAALEDFLRVSPHVRSLELALSSPTPANRSRSVDEGLVWKLSEMARASSGIGALASITIVDSVDRTGPFPQLRTLSDDMSAALPALSFAWTLRERPNGSRAHITFQEGSSAKVEASEGKEVSVGWLPSAPLRRYPMRIRTNGDGAVGVDYSIEARSGGGALASALAAYEAGPQGESLITWITPNFSELPNDPHWLVSGDFGIDPEAVAQACAAQSNGNYMLWDWRPAAAATARGHDGAVRSQPYFVLATVPDTLTSSIKAKIDLLRPGLTKDQIADRVTSLIRVLSSRAIGLNTLLAIGHYQALGALGFYFALQSLVRWVHHAPTGHLRMIVPVDAVDPLLRIAAASRADHDETTKRADLLCVTVRWLEGADRKPHVLFTPVEIKHYGLQGLEAGVAFPKPGESTLAEHLLQLRDYAKQLELLAKQYAAASPASSALLAVQLCTVLDSAIQLSPANMAPAASNVLKALGISKAILEVTPGVLLWYQPKGASGGPSAVWSDVPATDDLPRHLFATIDPVACDLEIWTGTDGDAQSVIEEMLALATSAPPVVAPSATSPLPETAGTTAALRANKTSMPQHSVVSQSDSRTVVDESTVSPPAIRPARRQLPEAILESRYQQIRQALSEFGVKVGAPTGEQPKYVEGPSFIEYAVSPEYGVSVSRIENQHENLKLRLHLQSDSSIGFRTHLGNVLITVPKPDAERYFVAANEIWERWATPARGFHVPIGEDVRGQIVSVELSNPNSPHFLIAGTTGGGKSEALLTLLLGAANFYGPDLLRLWMIDPKGTELVSLSKLPHCARPIGTTAQETIEVLDQAISEMDTRYQAFASSGARDIDQHADRGYIVPRWLVVLDEYADLVSDKDDQREIERRMKRLAAKARAAGIHILVSTQKPVISVVNTVVKSNLPGRIALRVSTAIESGVILDDTGAEDLTGKGDALIKVGTKTTRIQFAKYQD